jgi:hypothetical protein
VPRPRLVLAKPPEPSPEEQAAPYPTEYDGMRLLRGIYLCAIPSAILWALIIWGIVKVL